MALAKYNINNYFKKDMNGHDVNKMWCTLYNVYKLDTVIYQREI